CREKEPARRYASAEALAEDLERWLAGEPIQARPIHRAARAWRWCRQNPVVASLASAAALLLVLVVVVAAAGYANTWAALGQEAAARKEAQTAQAQEAQQRGIAEAQRHKAEREQQVAERHLYVARL